MRFGEFPSFERNEGSETPQTKSLLRTLDKAIKSRKKSIRVQQWDDWAEIMHDYVKTTTDPKYTLPGGVDLITFSDAKSMIWNILKYSIRLWTGKGKINDLKKICHYAQLAWTLSEGDLTKVGITNEKGD